jgi:hypothetical protein
LHGPDEKLGLAGRLTGLGKLAISTMGLFLSRRKKHRNTGCSGNLTAHWQIEARSYCLDCKSQTRSMQGLMPILECPTQKTAHVQLF